MQSQDKINEVRKLRDFAANLRGATDRWAAKYADRKHYDKQGFRFTPHSERAGAFRMPALGFEAYVGVYGSSSVSTAWKVDQDLINRFMAEALNTHKQAIFDTLAALAEADAAEKLGAARAELAAIKTMLDGIENPVAAVVEA